MIGFYDYTVMLTYMNVMSAMVGIYYALNNNIKLSMAFLIISGICDMFDGVVARSKKDRTDNEKKYGIQIDSLADVVSFGIFPVIIGYSLGLNTLAHMIIMGVYVLAGTIRLAFFNVSEMELQEKKAKRTYYLGLPVTCVAGIIPLVYSACIYFDYRQHLPMVYLAMLIFLSHAFLVKIKLPKIGWRTVIALCILAFPVIYFLVFRGGPRG